jgi:hypothetical protein
MTAASVGNWRAARSLRNFKARRLDSSELKIFLSGLKIAAGFCARNAKVHRAALGDAPRRLKEFAA